jgi:hypothetical protein
MGGAAFYRVGDGYLFSSFQSECRQHTIQKLSCCSNKRQATGIFFCPWAFTNEHPRTSRMNQAKYCLLSLAMEITAGASRDLLA